MTQKQTILEVLREGPLCSFTMFTDRRITHRLAARIHDLRRDGHAITTRPCDLGHKHSAPAVVYELVRVPEQGVLL